MKVLTHINMYGNQIVNGTFEKKESHPTGEIIEGRIYFNTIEKQSYIFANDKWSKLGSEYSQEFINLEYAPMTQVTFLNQYKTTPNIIVNLVRDKKSPNISGRFNAHNMTPIIDLIITHNNGENYYTGVHIEWDGLFWNNEVPTTIQDVFISVSVVGSI